jgi:hypothetical protein
MGGSAFLIHGRFDAERGAAAAPAPSWFGRLRGSKAPAVSTVAFPNGRSMLEFPAAAIHDRLAQDYLAYVRGRLTDPSAASTVVLDYLTLGQPRIYLRADREPGETDGPWYVQVSFSGAAGMAETSARVAAHWAGHWYAARRTVVDADILGPAGFSATGAEPLADMVFVPAGEYGYAELEDGVFAFDAAFVESHEDPEALRDELAQRFTPALREGRCRCQLCG